MNIIGQQIMDHRFPEEKEFTWSMEQDKKHIGDKMIIIVAWMIAVGLAILVYMKFRMIFH